MDREIPKVGEFYKHFKDKLYQILAVATHSETGEILVIYQALYGSFKAYARPLDMFMSEVDKNKYPFVEQIYRFEKVNPEDDDVKIKEDNEDNEDNTDSEDNTNSEDLHEVKPIEEQISKHLLNFLESESYDEKKAILMQNKLVFKQEELNCIYEVLGVSTFGGNERQQIAGLVRYLDMQEHYEGGRLRNR